MVVLIVMIVLMLIAVIFLKGEGDRYGKNVRKNEKRRVGFSDKNFFL